MNSTIKNILAVIAGLIFGIAINMLIINFGPLIIPYPEGYDVSSMDSMISTIHLLEPKHYVTPFLAHAIGTLVGALLTTFIAVSYKLQLTIGVSVFFLLGGIYMVYLLPNSPTWFVVLDLAGAYLPMGWLGWKIATWNK